MTCKIFISRTLRLSFAFTALTFLTPFMAIASCLDCSVKVLHVGDSQTKLDFGEKFYSFLKASFSEREFRLLGVSGSSPRHWIADKEHKESQWLCSQFGRMGLRTSVRMRGEVCHRRQFDSAFSEANRDAPSYVFFQFLGNSVGQSKDQLVKTVEKLLLSLRDEQKCFFMTSPPFHESLGDQNRQRRQTEAFIIQAVGERCIIFRGMELSELARSETNYREDLVHLSADGADKYLEAMKSYITSFLRE